MQTSVTLFAPFFVGLLMAIRGGSFWFSCRREFTLFFWDAEGFDFSVRLGFPRRASLSKTSLTDRVFCFGEELECISV